MNMLEDGEDPSVPAPKWRPQTKTKKSELEELKSLIRSFLEEIEHVPFRAVDCDQETVRDLMGRLERATKNKKGQKL